MNAMLLLIAVGAIAWEAVGRIQRPLPVAGGTLMVVAGIGIVISTITTLLFMRGSEADINIRGAFMHIAADALVSVAVVASGFLISWIGLLWIDPLTSLVIAAVIAWGTWSLLRQSLDMALDAVPEGIDTTKVRQFLESVHGVEFVHDLHIWGMSTTEVALTAHVVAPSGLANGDLRKIGEDVHDRFGIEHRTIQIETTIDHDWPFAPDDVERRIALGSWQMDSVR